ncbi:MAG: winged helix-turn-helix transcriptional regulator [Mycobacteriales bacterium]
MDSAAMKSYGQYCPMARTCELLAERWTLIIVRNLLAGCTTFSQLREGSPGISPALLTDRLTLLQRQGVIRRDVDARGRGCFYELTAKGRDLTAVCDAMGQWGARWLEIEPHHLDPAYAVWATCRLVNLDKVPTAGVTVRVVMRLPDASRQYWMLLTAPRAEVCTSSMGRVEDLVLTAEAETLAYINLQRLSFGQALRTGRITLDGSPSLVRAFPGWLRGSPYATPIDAGRSGASRS